MKNRHTMFAPTRILIPTDLSKGGLVALKIGFEMANKFDSHVDVVTVYEELPQDVYGDVKMFDTEVIKDVRKQIHNSLSQLTISDKVKDRIKIYIRKGNASDIVCKLAETNISDLIVMSTHGRIGVKRMRYGSVTEEVIKKSKVPVLAIKPTEKDRTFKPKKILVPLDFSKRDVVSLSHARRMNIEYKSLIKPVHVIPDISMEAFSLKLPSKLIKSCKERIAETMRHLELKGKAHVEYGDPVKIITAVATDAGCDLILISTRRKKGMLFGMLGSVSARVLRYSPCDVLTIPTGK